MQRVAMVVGKAFLLVGCAGFVPGVTANLDQLHLTGPGSPTSLLGLIPVTVAGNVLHLVLGAVAVFCASDDARARAFLTGGGALYVVLCVRSMVIGTGASGAPSAASSTLWVPLVAGVAMMVAGGLSSRPPVVWPLRGGFPRSG